MNSNIFMAERMDPKILYGIEDLSFLRFFMAHIYVALHGVLGVKSC